MIENIEIIIEGKTIRFKVTGSQTVKQDHSEDDFIKMIADEDKDESHQQPLEARAIAVRCAKACRWQQPTGLGSCSIGNKWVDPTDGKWYRYRTLPLDPNFWIPKLMNNLPDGFAVYQTCVPSTKELVWQVARIVFMSQGGTKISVPPISSVPELLHALLQAIERISKANKGE